MREIKFRAKREDNGEWTYGYINYRGCVSDDTWYMYSGGSHTRVDGKTRGQFTGLKDKNDKEIFEGDIIEYQSGLKPERVTIEFQVHCYNAGFYPSKSANASNYWEIIGNIHENPELLK